MKTTAELLEDGISSIALQILVFGPQVKNLSADPRTQLLQLKRMQIRGELEKCGHIVKYGEELIDLTLPEPMNNAFLQESLIMKEYDLIVTIVDSPGSICEASTIALKPELATKSSLFIDETYVLGLTGSMCRIAQTIGAELTTFKYPEDLKLCNLLGSVKKKVREVQIVRYLS